MDKKEYIDCGKLIDDIKRVYCAGCDNWNEVKCRACAIDDAILQIDSASAADVVEVVRCKDCKHLETVIDIIGDIHCYCGNADGKYITEVDWDDFCSHGEKREGTENG